MGRPRRQQSWAVYEPREERGRWRVVFIRPDGSRGSVGYATEEEARQGYREVREQLQRQAAANLEELVAKYRGHLVTVRGAKERSAQIQAQAILRFWEYDNTLTAAGMTPERARVRYRALVNAGFAAATHRESLYAARRMSAWMVEEGLLSANPILGIRPEGRVNRGKPQLTLDESRKLATLTLERAQRGDVRALAVFTCLLMGLRRVEILHLTVRSLDDGGRLLRVFESKTRAGQRVLEIPEVLRPLLLKLAEGLPSDALLFPYYEGWLRRAVKRMCKRAGVSDKISPHGLRGSHATLAVEAGATAHLVAAALGHTSPAVTLAHYVKPGTVERQQQERATLRLVK